MGFIGPNGAGKTTTLKCMPGLTQKTRVAFRCLGKTSSKNELEFKQQIGVSFGDMDFYSKTKIKAITDVVSRFYTNWDNRLYLIWIVLIWTKTSVRLNCPAE